MKKKVLLFSSMVLFFLVLGSSNVYSETLYYDFVYPSGATTPTGFGQNVDIIAIGNTGTVATLNTYDGTGSGGSNPGTVPVTITAGPDSGDLVHVGTQGLGVYNPSDTYGTGVTERIDSGDQMTLVFPTLVQLDLLSIVLGAVDFNDDISLYADGSLVISNFDPTPTFPITSPQDILNLDLSALMLINPAVGQTFIIEGGPGTSIEGDLNGFRLAGLTAKTPAVPEPTTMLLLGSGLVGLAGLRRKFRKS